MGVRSDRHGHRGWPTEGYALSEEAGRGGSSRPRRDRQPTLREIAEATGAHVSTVSRVLRQSEPPDGWSEKALRIRQAAEELSYQPNPWAASLRTRRTTTLGVVMPRLTDGVIATMYQGIEEAAAEAGYSALLSSPPDEPQAQRRSVRLLVSRQVDGLLLSSIHRPGADFLDSLDLRGLPMLLVNRHGDAGYPAVTGDDRMGGRLVADHLAGLGHRSVAVIAGPEHASTANDRVAGFLEGMAGHGVDVRPELVVRTEFESSGGTEGARRLLSRSRRPTAIFAVNDTAAVGVLSVARDLGIDVPEALSVVGYNDIPLVSLLPIPLTTVRSPARAIGHLAVGGLLDMIDGRPVDSVRMPVELVVRASTAPAPRRRRTAG